MKSAMTGLLLHSKAIIAILNTRTISKAMRFVKQFLLHIKELAS